MPLTGPGKHDRRIPCIQQQLARTEHSTQHKYRSELEERQESFDDEPGDLPALIVEDGPDPENELGYGGIYRVAVGRIEFGVYGFVVQRLQFRTIGRMQVGVIPLRLYEAVPYVPIGIVRKDWRQPEYGQPQDQRKPDHETHRHIPPLPEKCTECAGGKCCSYESFTGSWGGSPPRHAAHGQSKQREKEPGET